MATEHVFEWLAEQYQQDPNKWSTISEQASADWGSEPELPALLAYINDLSDSDRDSVLTPGSTQDSLLSQLRDGAFSSGDAGSIAEYPADQYPADQYPADQYPADQYPADQYPADQYPADQYPADSATGESGAAVNGSELWTQLSEDQMIELFELGVLTVTSSTGDFT